MPSRNAIDYVLQTFTKPGGGLAYGMDVQTATRHGVALNRLRHPQFYDIYFRSPHSAYAAARVANGGEEPSLRVHGTYPDLANSIIMHGVLAGTADPTSNIHMLVKSLPGGPILGAFFSARELCALGYPQELANANGSQHHGWRIAEDDTMPLRLTVSAATPNLLRRWGRKSGSNDQELYLTRDVQEFRLRYYALPENRAPDAQIEAPKKSLEASMIEEAARANGGQAKAKTVKNIKASSGASRTPSRKQARYGRRSTTRKVGSATAPPKWSAFARAAKSPARRLRTSYAAPSRPRRCPSVTASLRCCGTRTRAS